MKYAKQYIRSAEIIIGLYDGSMPLAAFLRNYFASQKKFGSKDRKHIAHLCYCYFRLGHACLHLPVGKRMKIALFLCDDAPGVWADAFETPCLGHWGGILAERARYVQSTEPSFSMTGVFPWQEELSETIDFTGFAMAHFIQPSLFLRLRPGNEERVTEKLEEAGIAFRLLGNNCVALTNASKIDATITIDKEAVVQDYNSQRIGEMLQLVGERLLSATSQTLPVTIWDCCAASGGKSMLAKDLLKNTDLTVSDIRPSILHNLEQRFLRAGIHSYHAFTADLASGRQAIQAKKYQLIICDVPCSGSGTWSRTPEQLYYFEKEQIDRYASLQRKIVTTAQQSLEEGGYLLYITCSVFKKENEEQVFFIQENFKLELVAMELLKGYDRKADSMFAALFKKQALRAG